MVTGTLVIGRKTVASGGHYTIKVTGLRIFPVRYTLADDELKPLELGDPGYVTLRKAEETNEFYSTSYTTLSLADSPKPKSVSAAGLPNVTGRKYVLTGMRPGWIYVFNNDKKLWYEYEISESLQLHRCQWTSPVKDIRPANDTVYNYIELKSSYEYYLGYSDIQWSQKFLAKLELSEEQRKKNMTKVNAPEVLADTLPPHVVDPSEVDVVFNTSVGSFSMVDFNIFGKLPYDIKYCAIPDPIGIVDQLAQEVAYYFEQIEALVQSVQIGESPERITSALRSGKDPATLKNKKMLEEAMALHKMALTLYQLGFSNSKSIDKWGQHLDKNRIEKLLAVKERKELREKVEKCQNNLLTVTMSDFYQKSLGPYKENTPERKIIGKERVSSHLPLLAMKPNAKDKMLDLNQKGSGDKETASMKYLADVLNENNEVGKILAATSLITIGNIPMEHAIVQTWNNIISTFFEEVTSKQIENITILVRRLNSIKITNFSEPFFEELDMLPFYKRVKLIGDPKIQPLPDKELLKGLEKAGDKLVEVKQLSLSEKVVQASRPDHDIHFLSDRFYNSPKRGIYLNTPCLYSVRCKRMAY